MEFIAKMKQQGKMGFLYKRIEFKDNVALSIQASSGHYCMPKFDFSNSLQLEYYTHMEFALFSEGEFFTVEGILPIFTKLDEIEKYQDTVYGYVPVALIECLYQELKSTYGLKGE